MNEAFDIVVKILMLAMSVGVGYLIWQLKTNTAKVNQLSIDVAVINSIISTAREDHDKVILMESRVSKAESDIHGAHDKIRELSA